MDSVSLFEKFGNETKYTLIEDTVVAYLDRATIKFPLPEASVDVLEKLTTSDYSHLDPTLLEQVELRLVSLGFKEAKARTMSLVLCTVAKTQNVSPFTFFNVNENTLKLTVDTYNTINGLRPPGNRINVALPLSNQRSRYNTLIKP
jgi:hypothetical protein